MKFLLGLFCLVWTCGPALAQTPVCGPDAACEVAGGDYHLLFPDDWDGTTALPVLVFFHGYRSSGAAVFRAGSLKTSFARQGYLIIAPNGALRPGSNIRAWPARPMPDGERDDVAFTLRVVEDVARRVPVDQARLYVAGFSAGGSMAWRIACFAGERFAGFVSVAGALRRPTPPVSCPSGPVRLLQIHGFADTQVPLEGRSIRDWHQGDVSESLGLMRATNKCRSNPDRIETGERFWCRSWAESCDGGALKMCIHDGGHGLPNGWSDLAKDWLENP